MLAVKLAVFVEFELFLRIPTIFLRGVVLALALAALERDQFNCGFLGSHTLSP
jgi:hypothetical protein